MAYISGAWGRTRLFCGNHPAGEEHEMQLAEAGGAAFYACGACRNRLRPTDFEKMLEHVAKLVAQADLEGTVLNPSGHKWTRNGIAHEVTGYSDEHIDIRAVDRKSLARRRP